MCLFIFFEAGVDTCEAIYRVTTVRTAVKLAFESDVAARHESIYFTVKLMYGHAYVCV